MLTFKRAEKLSKKATQIFLPVIEGKVSAPEIAKLFDLNLADELAFFAPGDKPLKAGEIYEIPVSATGYQCDRLSFVSLGKLTNAELRAAGAAIGRKLRGKNNEAFVNANLKSAQAKIFLVSMNLGNFTWNLKTGTKVLTAKVEISNVDEATLDSAQIVSDAVNRARSLIHTPSNIKNPEWMAKQAKKFANGVKVEVVAHHSHGSKQNFTIKIKVSHLI